MTIEQALNIIKPEANTADALKKAYWIVAKQFHPDINPSGEEIMKMINLAYECLRDQLGTWDLPGNKEEAEDILIKVASIIEQCRDLEGIAFEICGNWIWITGETYKNKTILKSIGLSYAPNKKAWYWKPSDYKKRNRSEWSMDDIRETWGSQKVCKETRMSL